MTRGPSAGDIDGEGMSETSKDKIHNELWKLYENWFVAIPGHDSAFFERTLSDDWHYTNVDAEVRGKREYFEYISPIDPNSPTNRLVEMVVRPFGDIVVVHGLYEVPPELAPPNGIATRFTAVWIRRQDQWMALTHHATRVPQAGP